MQPAEKTSHIGQKRLSIRRGCLDFISLSISSEESYQCFGVLNPALQGHFYETLSNCWI